MEETDDKLDQLIQKHKKEKKELQNKIQGLKKTVPKGDKKKKKEVQEVITKLESELTQKQDAELNELQVEGGLGRKQIEVEEVIKSLENLIISDDKKPVKVTKAQKRRDKKAAEQKQREKYILEQEKENENGSRHIETKKISEILEKDGLMIHEIEADGNCLYNAVDYQMKMKAKISYGAVQLRRATSKVMKSNPGEYLPFLSNPDTGEMMTEEEYFDYCDKVANTCDWGGQVELRALSHVLKRPIKVIQADGPILVMGEEYSANEDLIICYHRHMYKLGEHYNSVKTLIRDESTSENVA